MGMRRYTDKVESIIPRGLTRTEYLELALACLDQAGCSETQQDAVLGICAATVDKQRQLELSLTAWYTERDRHAQVEQTLEALASLV